eukprot:s125_g17.t4
MSVMLARSGTCGTTLDCIVAEQPRTPRTAQQETLVKRPRPCALIGIEQPQLDVALTSLWDAWPSCSLACTKRTTSSWATARSGDHGTTLLQKDGATRAVELCSARRHVLQMQHQHRISRKEAISKPALPLAWTIFSPAAPSQRPTSSHCDGYKLLCESIVANISSMRSESDGLAGKACASRFGRLQPEEVERSLVTLLQTLQASCQSYWKGEEVHVWSVGHNKWFKTGRVVAVRETEEGGRAVGSVLVTFVEMADSRPSRKWVSPANIPAVLRKAAEVKISRDDLDKIVRIAELCAEREYHAASQVYLELTVGHGRWHGDLSEKHEKGEEVAEIGSQANQRTQLDPVLAQRWEKLQKTEFPVEDDIDPVLAKRWSQQQELVDSGLYEAEIGSAADKSTKLDPTLAKHWAAAHERALAGKGIPDPEEVGPKADFSRSGFSRTNAMCYTLGILPQWMDCRKDTELAKRFAKLQRQAQRNEGGEAERCQLQFSAGESKEHEVSTEGSGSAIGRLQWSAVVLADFTIDLEVCAVVRIPPEMESTETIVTSVLFKFSNSFSWFTGKEVELVFLRD